MVLCRKCKEQKPEHFFHKSKANKTGFQNQCIECKKQYFRLYYLENIDKLKEYKQKNIEKIKSYLKQYRKENIDKAKEYQKEHIEKIKLTKKRHYENNIEFYKEYRQINKKKFTERKVRQRRQRLDSDPLFKFTHNARSVITGAFRRNGNKKFKKQTRTETLLGCTIPELRDHLEKQFQPGMTWENHGLYGWHVDHIMPIASAKTQEEIERLCHYTNLQPLWAVDNIRKRDKITIDTTR